MTERSIVRVAVPGAELYVEQVGQGPPLLLLHGGPGLDHRHLLGFQSLSDRFRVLFYDQRASGQSTGEPTEEQITIPRFVQDIEAVREALHLETLHLLGHSWGGVLALHYAIAFPKRLRSLVLLGCYASAAAFAPFLTRMHRRTTAQEREQMTRLRQSEAFVRREPEAVSALLTLSVRAMFHDPSKVGALDLTLTERTARNQSTIADLLFRRLQDFDIHSELHQVDCPCLVVHAESDPIPQQAAEKIASHLPQARLEVLANTGHFLFSETPERVYPLVSDFLRQSEAARSR